MHKPPRVAKFEEMARTMVGDGGSPNIYFVGVGGSIALITSNFDAAYEAWSRATQAARGTKVSTVLEDRKNGTLADYDEHEFVIGDDDKTQKIWDVIDDAERFIKKKG